MRNLKIIGLIALPILTLVTCMYLDKSPTTEPTASIFPLIGNTYSLVYHPVNTQDKEQKFMSNHMNKMGISVEFQSDTLAAFVVNGNLSLEKWGHESDTVTMSDKNYLLQTKNCNHYLLAKDEIIELLPL